ncbi:MAG: ATP-binding cassette domain-containing protein [Candidatus Latescibacteria bacterium]|nr:ATP-binding cassette domain-containing protein [Candidatus Latescibacterota bacterium]NIM65810.1 ATP-binding cassette domain-containing protein [Candidatus Latescibacterota bacterium]NIO02302.1 ATP-binding cassette domain-containing protein [Candidatus Latescibacterota bacterium]NIO29173.1 ATP-binding cassette domain-containing protein [Candidatus Latescibacterota bacterium]NIO56788.1 ATP-binding cassette domain-containing protein [Candidatus Latescibacterota bacterium]
MIAARDLTKVFRTEEVETTALDRIRLTVDDGEFVAVMGPSGCGKSTLLNILGLLDTPTGGEYMFHGDDVSSCPERKRSRLRRGSIGFVFQSFNLIDDLTVAENVELPLVYQRVTADERKRKVSELLEKFSLQPRRNHFPQQLSGGQQQRVAVARAVVTEPKLILADEPTGNLDSAHGEEVMKLLMDLNEAGTSIVMVTHSPACAAHAHRVVNLFDGRIVTEQRGRISHV